MFVMTSQVCYDKLIMILKKSVCPDFIMFVMMSKYVMRTNGSSLLQKVRHDVKKTSSHQKICHDVINMPNVCHEIKNIS